MADIVSLLIDTVPFIAIFSVITISLNIEYGYAGLPNFGKVLPVLGGAIVAGSLVPRMLQALVPGAPQTDYIFNNGPASVELQSFMNSHPADSAAMFALGILISLLVGAALGYVAVLPTLRLREDYLAIVLIAVAEIFRAVSKNYDPILNGPRGVSVPDPLGWLGPKSLVYLYVSSGLLIASIVFVNYMLSTPFGRALKAMRENELTAQSLGIDIYSLKLKSLVMGSALAAAAGYVDTMYSGGLTVDKYDRYLYTFIPWLMLLLGGSGNNFGAVVGAAAYWTVSRILNIYKDQVLSALSWILSSAGLGGVDISWFDVTRLERFLFAIAIIAILMARPQGVLPERPLRTPGYRMFEKLVRSRSRGREGSS